MSDKKSFTENPPDLLAIAGAYSAPGIGGACVGVLAQPMDESFYQWRFAVYKKTSEAKSLSQRMVAIGDLLKLPVDGDSGFSKMKATYSRIRAFDAPTELPGLCSLAMNVSEVSKAMLHKHLTALEEKEQDLAGFLFKEVDDDKETTKQVIEWVDCLFSVIVDGRMTFLESDRADDFDDLISSIQDLELTKAGKLSSKSPLLMALIFSVGRAEWLIKTERSPFQIIMRGLKK